MPQGAAMEAKGRITARIGAICEEHRRVVGVAESLTGGQLACALAAAEDSAAWFAGSIVAYRTEVKHGLLATPPGPVVTPATALAMADSAARLLGADTAIGITGAGGPEPQDGAPPGTVHIAARVPHGPPLQESHRFAGAPEDVLDQAVAASLALLERALRGS